MNKNYFPYFIGLFIFLSSLVILLISPRADIKTLIFFLFLALITTFIIKIFLHKEERKFQDSIDSLINLLQSIDLKEDKVTLKNSYLGTLQDEILKSITEKKNSKDEAINNKILMKNYIEDITHQIKTPLTGILLLLDLTEADPENLKEYTERIRNNILRITNLSDLLLKMSSLDADIIKMEEKPFSAKALILDCEMNLESLIKNKNLNLSIEGQGFEIIGDRRWIFEAILNVLKNAIDISPHNSMIVVKLQESLIFKSIFIIDNGPGIAKETKDKLFQRFYKLDTNSSGFGIGLPMAKRIMEKHDGDILIQSDPRGSSFELRFYK
ncbi:sensor histidine kinase [Paratissierella segnis]|jgi:signal transduction histidine kinase|uniref:histidine kinase n=1 Tax=Paratissierella segnis TaxID=2763679 RepID=A0A926EX05_9FIRM|nr:HAMP domain-containing sensor histidine kinase [Paratissierella segnis]MBC8589097.1 HAMP domain-containing histidine kinase [Paratissierella segnis]